MGQPSPYDDEDDSSLNESEDDEIVAVMTDDKFYQQVNDLIHSIMAGEYTMDAALINIQQIKHGFSKNNEACLGAILPAILNEVADMMNDGMKRQQKLAVLEDKLPKFKDMLNAFISDNDDEVEIIYLVTRTCSQKMDLLGECFYLILQLLWNESIIHDQAILDWLSSAHTKVDNADQQEDQKEEEKEPLPGDSYGSEGEEEESIPIDHMRQFLAGMKKFEEHLQSQAQGEGEEDAEYYDEEEGGEEY